MADKPTATEAMVFAAHEAFELTGHFSTLEAMEKAINAALSALATPTSEMRDAEGHKRGVEAVANKIRSPSTFPGETATKVAIELVAAYLEASGAVLCDAQPVGYVTGSNMRGLIDGVQGVMTVSNVQNALFQNPIYAEPPAQLEYKIAAWMVRENERDDWDFVRLKTSATDLEARGYEVTPLYTRTPKTEA